MGDLERSFRYPWTGEGWGPKLALGGALCILGSLLEFIPWVGRVFGLLISFFPLGYAYQVFRDHLRGTEGPLPEWGDWGGLFAKGFLVFAVSLGYGLIPILLFWTGTSLWQSGGFAAFLSIVPLILWVGVGLVASFLLPMALAFFSRENESFAAAYRWSGIVEKIWVVQREYFVGWLAVLILLLVLLFVQAYFLYVGWILHALGIFYLGLAAAHLFGRVCRAGLEAKR